MYWDMEYNNNRTMTSPSPAAAETRSHRPSAHPPTARPLRTFSRHAWPAVSGLAVAVGRPWPLQRSDPCATPDGVPFHRNAPCRGRTRLWWAPRSPDRQNEAGIACACSSPFVCIPAGRLNPLTGEMRADAVTNQFVTWVILSSKVAASLVALKGRLLELEQAESMVVD